MKKILLIILTVIMTSLFSSAQSNNSELKFENYGKLLFVEGEPININVVVQNNANDTLKICNWKEITYSHKYNVSTYYLKFILSNKPEGFSSHKRYISPEEKYEFGKSCDSSKLINPYFALPKDGKYYVYGHLSDPTSYKQKASEIYLPPGEYTWHIRLALSKGGYAEDSLHLQIFERNSQQEAEFAEFIKAYNYSYQIKYNSEATREQIESDESLLGFVKKYPNSIYREKAIYRMAMLNNYILLVLNKYLKEIKDESLILSILGFWNGHLRVFENNEHLGKFEEVFKVSKKEFLFKMLVQIENKHPEITKFMINNLLLNNYYNSIITSETRLNFPLFSTNEIQMLKNYKLKEYKFSK